MSMKYISLYLDAPLQAWGYHSKYERRTTLSYPTKSGIVGIICSAQGIKRNDVDGIKRIADLKMKIIELNHGDGLLIDFHTVGGGWDKFKNPMNVLINAEGKKMNNAAITLREYLQSARFGVIIEGNSNLLYDIAKALKNPKWGTWLGRKSCIPASPIYQKTFNSFNEAKHYLFDTINKGKCCRIISDDDAFESGMDTLLDFPVDFEKRIYRPRRVRVDTEDI